MNKEDKDFWTAMGALALLGWLLKKKHGKCPRCNYPVTDENAVCPNCMQPLDWGNFK